MAARGARPAGVPGGAELLAGEARHLRLEHEVSIMSVGRSLFTSSFLLVGVLTACGTDEPATTPQAREPAAARMVAMAATAPAAPAPAFEGQLVAYQEFSTSAPPSWATFSFFDHAHSAAACLQGAPLPIVARPGAPRGCVRRDCTDADLPLGDADAGTLTITGPMGRRSITPDAGFYFLFEEGRAWSGGERISFATSGGGGPDGVPSVSTAVQAPRRARLTTPVAGRTLDRDRDRAAASIGRTTSRGRRRPRQTPSPGRRGWRAGSAGTRREGSRRSRGRSWRSRGRR